MILIEGYSDDTFGEYETTTIDHDDCGVGSIRIYRIIDPEGVGLDICGQYNPKGTPGYWRINVQVDETDSLPDWPISIKRGERSYSPALIVDAPEGSTLRLICPSEDS